MFQFNKQKPLSTPPTIIEYKNRLFHPRHAKGGLRIHGEFPKKAEHDIPLVSIITIVRNGVKTLEKTIQSVLNQTYDNIEYIIIDGGSTDGTLNIIKKYDHKISYWISEPDEGISDAFNKGISAASGEIIGVINADDWYENDAVNRVVEHFSETQADIVYGIVQYWDNNKKAELVYANDTLLNRDMTINHPAVFAKRSTYETIGLFRKDFRYAMDYEWLLRAKSKNMKFSYIENCLANIYYLGISDKYWWRARWEVAKAKEINSPSVLNYLYFLFQILKTTVRGLLDRIGLQAVTNFYHKKVSIIKKIK